MDFYNTLIKVEQNNGVVPANEIQKVSEMKEFLKATFKTDKIQNIN